MAYAVLHVSLGLSYAEQHYCKGKHTPRQKHQDDIGGQPQNDFNDKRQKGSEHHKNEFSGSVEVQDSGFCV